MTTVLENQIMVGVIPAESEISTIANYCKGKGNSLQRGNYRGLKLTDQILKKVEKIIEKLIRQQVDINQVKFDFMPGCRTTNITFILRQLQDSYYYF